MGKIALWVSGAMLAIALGLYLLTRPAAPVATPEDAEARRIVEACAIGTSEEARAGLSTGLARGLRQVDAGAVVTTSRVGAIVDKIGPDAVGRDTYEIYVACLKQQFELSLKARGVRIDPEPRPSPSPTPLPADTSATGQASPEHSPRPVRGVRSDTSDAVRAPSAPARNQTTGNCSPIISGSTIGNYSAKCEEKTE